MSNQSLEWMDQAECRDADPALFHADITSSLRKAAEPYALSHRAAINLCARCDVRLACLAYCLETEMPSLPYGVWGGHTPTTRRAARVRSLPPQERLLALERWFRTELAEKVCGRGVYVSEGLDGYKAS